MIIDIGAHLRRLVLAGLPLLGAGCDLPGTGEPPGPTPGPLTQACQPRVVHGAVIPGAKPTGIGFSRDDRRVADLYEACHERGDYCLRLCEELLRESQTLPPSHVLIKVASCELGCDRSGEPVATIAFASGPPPAVGRRPEGYAGAVLGAGTVGLWTREAPNRPQ